MNVLVSSDLTIFNCSPKANRVSHICHGKILCEHSTADCRNSMLMHHDLAISLGWAMTRLTVAALLHKANEGLSEWKTAKQSKCSSTCKAKLSLRASTQDMAAACKLPQLAKCRSDHLMFLVQHPHNSIPQVVNADFAQTEHST